MSGEEEQKEIKVLHVDDEFDFLALTKVFLARENDNFSIDTTTSVEEGIERLNDGKYDVVISDYQMPRIDGLEFLRNLRQGGSTIPFIMFTGKGREEVAMEALNKGANHYLQKGEDVKSMYGTLAHVIRKEAEKKRTEDKLAEVEKERQIILDSLPAMIYHMDRDSNFIYANKLLADACGMNPADFKGKSTRAIFPEEADAYVKSDKEVVKSGRPQRGIIGEFHTSEGKRWVRTDKIPLKDANGNVTSIIGSAVDITEHKRAEKELKESRKFLETVIENIPDTITLKDSEHRFVLVNQTYCNITGITKDEVIGKTVFWEKDMEVFRTGKGLAFPERTYTDVEGTHHYISVKKAPLADESGKITHVLTITHDITERKRAEEEREQLIKELEAKNAELEKFTCTVSHDLRSPLVTIQGFADILREDLERNEKEKVESDIKHIETAATRMDRLLKDTLQLSRIGRVMNPPGDVPFGELVQEALQETAEQIKSSGVEVSVVEDLPTVHVDRMRVVVVLVNLIANSITYMGEQSHPKIEIGHRVDGEETVFIVKDNGIGIDKSQQEKVFELFYKVDRSSKETGAGLAIVKRIIEVHGGRIWIESEKGKGCTVCFTLPVT